MKTMQNSTFFSQDSGQGYYNAPQQPPQPPQPPQGYNQPSKGSSTNAILALIFGILSYIACGIFSAIPAWIIGKNEIARINAGQSPESNRTMATIGMWLGIVGVILFVIGLIVLGILLALGVFAAASSTHYSY